MSDDEGVAERTASDGPAVSGEAMADWVTVPKPVCDLCGILSAARRCEVLRLLAESDDVEHSLRELAKPIAAVEEGVSVEQATGDPYENVYVALYQTHLPALAEAGIVRYDADRKVVRRGERFRLAVLVLALAQTTYVTVRQTGACEDTTP